MSRLILLLTVALGLTGCGRKPSEEECSKAFDHMIGLMKGDETTAGSVGMMEGMKGRLVNECRKGSKKELECIMAAKTLAEARACGGGPPPKDEADAASPSPSPSAEEPPRDDMKFEPEAPPEPTPETP